MEDHSLFYAILGFGIVAIHIFLISWIYDIRKSAISSNELLELQNAKLIQGNTLLIAQLEMFSLIAEKQGVSTEEINNILGDNN